MRLTTLITICMGCWVMASEMSAGDGTAAGAMPPAMPPAMRKTGPTDSNLLNMFGKETAGSDVQPVSPMPTPVAEKPESIGDAETSAGSTPPMSRADSMGSRPPMGSTPPMRWSGSMDSMGSTASVGRVSSFKTTNADGGEDVETEFRVKDDVTEIPCRFMKINKKKDIKVKAYTKDSFDEEVQTKGRTLLCPDMKVAQDYEEFFKRQFTTNGQIASIPVDTSWYSNNINGYAGGQARVFVMSNTDSFLKFEILFGWPRKGQNPIITGICIDYKKLNELSKAKPQKQIEEIKNWIHCFLLIGSKYKNQHWTNSSKETCRELISQITTILENLAGIIDEEGKTKLSSTVRGLSDAFEKLSSRILGNTYLIKATTSGIGGWLGW